MHFKKYLLLYTLIPLLVLISAASYYRFMATGDYMISFEGDCDPYTESCFVDCEDEECTSEYYFTKIYRHAAETYALCESDDVTTCDAAYECTSASGRCTIVYCDPAGEFECEALEKN